MTTENLENVRRVRKSSQAKAVGDGRGQRTQSGREAEVAMMDDDMATVAEVEEVADVVMVDMLVVVTYSRGGQCGRGGRCGRCGIGGRSGYGGRSGRGGRDGR